jgi:tetratricopeptide (TPR) repeat protein
MLISVNFFSMQKIFFLFVVILFTAISVNAKDISNIDILQSISEALSKNKIKTENDIKISADSKNIKSGPEFAVTLIAPKVDNKLHSKKLEAYKTLQKGYYEVAFQLYKKLNKSYPKDNEIKFSLAYTYHKLNQFGSAKKLYYQLINSNYKFKGKAINNILDIVTADPTNDALFILKKLSAENSNNPYILSRLSFYYEKKDKLNEAILLMQKAYYSQPKEFSHKINLAILYDKNKEYQNAISLYQQIVGDYNQNKITDKEIPIFKIKNRLEFIKKL